MIALWLGIALLIAALIVKKNKVLYRIQLLYLWLVASNNNGNADYVNYLNGYVNIFNYNGKISEPFYWMLARISNFIGLDFLGYRYLFFALALIALGIGIWKLSVFPNVILALYFVYPFTMDVVQMRTMMSNALVLLSIWKIKQYTEESKSKHLIVSIMLFIIALGFHYSSIAAVIVYCALLSKDMLRKSIVKLLSLGLICVLTILVFGTQINNKLIALGILEKAINYQDSGLNVGGYIICVFLSRIIFVVICWLSVHSSKKIRDQRLVNKYHSNEFLLKCVGLLSIYAILELTITMEIERISRIALITGYSLICNASVFARNDNYRIIKVMTFLFVLGYFYVMFFRHFAPSSNWFEYAFLPIFENNLMN